MSKESLVPGDLFIVSDVGEVTSFSIVLFSGEYDYQKLTQSVYTQEQAASWENIAYVISDNVNIPVNQLRTVVIEPISESGDDEMLDALGQGKDGKHPNVKHLGVLEQADQIGQIHKLFMSDEEVNRDMAASMLIGSLNETFGKLLQAG